MIRDLVQPQSQPEITQAAAAWLEAKQHRSGSARTVRAYALTLASFFAALKEYRLDANDRSRVKELRLAIQEWAGRSVVKDDQLTSPAASTYNHRIAVVSSFYEFAIRGELFEMVNPAELVDRAVVQQNGKVKSFDVDSVGAVLATINRTTLRGMRDYAILVVGLHTGRRVSELAGVRWCDVTIEGDVLSVFFRRCKGGKSVTDVLPTPVALALLSYLDAAKEALAEDWNEQHAIWLGFSPRLPLAPAGSRAIAGIVKRYFGKDASPHRLRHTFAVMMERAGAPLSDIRDHLLHSNIATTEIYMRRTRPTRNQYADAIAAMLHL